MKTELQNLIKNYKNIISNKSLNVVQKFESISELSDLLHYSLREMFVNQVGQEFISVYQEMIDKSEEMVDLHEVSIEMSEDKFFILIDDEKKPLLTSSQIASHLSVADQNLDLVRLFLSNEDTLLRMNLVLK